MESCPQGLGNARQYRDLSPAGDTGAVDSFDPARHLPVRAHSLSSSVSALRRGQSRPVEAGRRFLVRLATRSQRVAAAFFASG
jgi:hypothetical protein